MIAPKPGSETILVVAPLGRDSAVATRVLTDAGIRAESLPDIEAALGRLPGEVGALLLTAEALTGERTRKLGERLQLQPPWSDLPVLLLGDRSAPGRESLGIQQFLQQCANLTLLERPLRTRTLLSSVQAALRARRRQYEVRNFSATLEGAVRERTAALEELVKTLRAFTYTVAHDLRAPIRTIHRYSELLLADGLQGATESRDYLKEIGRAAHGMDDLIQALLAYSRLTRSEIRTTTVDLGSVVRQVLGHLDYELRERQAIVRIEGTLPPVSGDETMISQILMNLLTNAAKFVAPGVTPHITVRAAPAGDRVKLVIEDNGIGIDPAFHEKAFEVFERLGAGERYAGTGIGLAIVRRAAELMGGRAGVDSALGKGSRFWIELPAAKGNG